MTEQVIRTEPQIIKSPKYITKSIQRKVDSGKISMEDAIKRHGKTRHYFNSNSKIFRNENGSLRKVKHLSDYDKQKLGV